MCRCPYRIMSSTFISSVDSTVSGRLCEDVVKLVSDVHLTNLLLVQFTFITALTVAGFVCTKSIYDHVRCLRSRLTVLIVGAGPIGLTSALASVRSGRTERLVIYEEELKNDVFNRANQVAFNMTSISFLRGLGVDFDNMEGCWRAGLFSTRVGVFLEYILSILQQYPVELDIKFGTKFCRDSLRFMDTLKGRLLVILCDGTKGIATRTLGLSDEYIQHSCKAYGAMAALEHCCVSALIPTPERRVHGLNFNLAAYGIDTCEPNGAPGFHLKLFGTTKHRHMSLVVPKCDTRLVKAMRIVLDRSLMRNIFLKCFNTYKSEEETSISDSIAMKYLKFSPRLFEIKLTQRQEVASYFEDADMFIIVEGDAARSYNFNTGLDVNVGLRGLTTLSRFMGMASCAETEHSILEALVFKSNHADLISKEFVRVGLKEHMFS